MKRLTKSNRRGGFYFVECFRRCDGDPQDCGNCTDEEKICQKLGLYEETGLEPEEVKDLMELRMPKKPILAEIQDDRYAMNYVCPSCGRRFSATGIADFCYHCGQALDWELDWESVINEVMEK